MPTKSQTVATATQEEKVSHIYDAFNLTKEQSRSVIDKTAPIMQKYAGYTTSNCDVLKACVDAVETTEEKLYASHLFGIFYGVSQYSDVNAVDYFSEM